MAKPKKKIETVDVYLYYLLKRMIEFEVHKTMAFEPTREAVITYIKENSPFSEEERNTVAEYIRRNLWKPKPEKIGERELDWMVKIIRTLGTYTSWKQFESRFAIPYHPDSKVMLTHPHSESDIRSRTQIIMTILYYQAWQRGNLDFSPKQHMLYSQLEYHDVTILPIVSRVDIDNLNLVYMFYKDLTSGYHREYATLVEWYDKNPFIFYACTDTVHSVTSILSVLPLKENFIDSFKNGDKSKSDIESEDIYSLEEKELVNYVFLESFMSVQISSIRNYKVLFNDIISLVADKENQNLIVCSVGCSFQAEQLLKTYGFQETAYRVRIDSSAEKHPFFEITWLKLNSLLSVYNSVFLGPNE